MKTLVRLVGAIILLFAATSCSTDGTPFIAVYTNGGGGYQQGGYYNSPCRVSYNSPYGGSRNSYSNRYYSGRDESYRHNFYGPEPRPVYGGRVDAHGRFVQNHGATAGFMDHGNAGWLPYQGGPIPEGARVDIHGRLVPNKGVTRGIGIRH